MLQPVSIRRHFRLREGRPPRVGMERARPRATIPRPEGGRLHLRRRESSALHAIGAEDNVHYSRRSCSVRCPQRETGLKSGTEKSRYR